MSDVISGNARRGWSIFQRCRPILGVNARADSEASTKGEQIPERFGSMWGHLCHFSNSAEFGYVRPLLAWARLILFDFDNSGAAPANSGKRWGILANSGATPANACRIWPILAPFLPLFVEFGQAWRDLAMSADQLSPLKNCVTGPPSPAGVGRSCARSGSRLGAHTRFLAVGRGAPVGLGWGSVRGGSASPWRPDCQGRAVCVRCGRSAPSAVTLERHPCVPADRWPAGPPRRCACACTVGRSTPSCTSDWVRAPWRLTWRVRQRAGSGRPQETSPRPPPNLGQAPPDGPPRSSFGFSSFVHLRLPAQLNAAEQLRASEHRGCTDGTTSFSWKTDGGNMSERLECPGRLECELSEGFLYVFPQWVQHLVNPFSGPGERRTVAANVALIERR